MAEFFNKKEEMLEVQLTEYGKYLLSMGRLSPKYYTFHDDEIMYNAAYAPSASDGTRISETQNDIDRRIRFETPNLKVVPTRTGAETRVARFVSSVSGALGSANSDPAENVEAFQQESFIETVNFSSYPIGSALLTSDKTAAWAVRALKNTIDSTQDYIVTNPSSSFADINNGVITRIPQLNIDIDYQLYYQEGELDENAISDHIEGAPGEIFLSLREDYLVLEIIEENTNTDKENFEIEVFFESTQTGSGVPPVTLEQMAYVEARPTIPGEPPGISFFEAPKPLGNNATNVGNVEYYFDIYVDGDIPIDVASAAGIISSPAAGALSSPINLNRNLYITEDEEPC